MARSIESITEYVELEIGKNCRVTSVKLEESFKDLGVLIRSWNVSTDTQGDWWVIEGDTVPMNLYTKQAYYLSSDEAYSFHMGLMLRMGQRN